ncbi:MAG: tail fiber domain-containing protein [Chloroflexota bacterium]
MQLASGGGSWSNLSDRAAKENFFPVDGRDILERLAAIPIQTWNYKSQDASIRHIGPVAQDFYAAFGVGEDDTHITTVDADGVALAGIQELYELSQEQDARIIELEGRVDALEEQNAAQQAQIHILETRLQALERQVGGTSTPVSDALPVSGLALGGLAVLGAVAYRRREGGGR